MKRAALAVALLVLTGCGASATTSAADEVPALGTRLENVDGFVAAHEWGKARAALRGIVADAEAARQDGTLDDTVADRVVASAQRLLAALPAPVTPSATPTPVRTATAPTTGTQSSRDHQGKGEPKGTRKHKGNKH